ncbi:MAG: hypothetical protein ACE5NG_08695 [bacterium]
MKTKNSPYKMDKTAFSVTSLLDESDEKEHWISKTPHQRLEALELMRQTIYGYDPVTTRLQRFFEVAELTQS